jgi:hypothetical protein
MVKLRYSMFRDTKSQRKQLHTPRSRQPSARRDATKHSVPQNTNFPPLQYPLLLHFPSVPHNGFLYYRSSPSGEVPLNLCNDHPPGSAHKACASCASLGDLCRAGLASFATLTLSRDHGPCPKSDPCYVRIPWGGPVSRWPRLPRFLCKK